MIDIAVTGSPSAVWEYIDKISLLKAKAHRIGCFVVIDRDDAGQVEHRAHDHFRISQELGQLLSEQSSPLFYPSNTALTCRTLAASGLSTAAW